MNPPTIYCESTKAANGKELTTAYKTPKEAKRNITIINVEKKKGLFSIQ